MQLAGPWRSQVSVSGSWFRVRVLRLTILPQLWATDLMAPNLSWTLESPMPALNSKDTDVCALGQPGYFNKVIMCVPVVTSLRHLKSTAGVK